jgi:hypothetical protein
MKKSVKLQVTPGNHSRFLPVFIEKLRETISPDCRQSPVVLIFFNNHRLSRSLYPATVRPSEHPRQIRRIADDY